jgi:hypothetical protein
MTRGLALFSAVSWACLYVLKQVLELAVSRRMVCWHAPLPHSYSCASMTNGLY